MIHNISELSLIMVIAIVYTLGIVTTVYVSGIVYMWTFVRDMSVWSYIDRFKGLLLCVLIALFWPIFVIIGLIIHIVFLFRK